MLHLIWVKCSTFVCVKSSFCGAKSTCSWALYGEISMFHHFSWLDHPFFDLVKSCEKSPKKILAKPSRHSASLGSQAYPGNQVKSERGLATRRMEECKCLVISGARRAPGVPRGTTWNWSKCWGWTEPIVELKFFLPFLEPLSATTSLKYGKKIDWWMVNGNHCWC